MITLLYYSAQRANVDQNEHSSAGLTQQHNGSSGSDSQSCCRTHSAPRGAHSSCTGTAEINVQFDSSHGLSETRDILCFHSKMYTFSSPHKGKPLLHL